MQQDVRTPALGTLTVVGIGASAGGLKALQQFIEALQPDSGMAYVIIQHLDPDRESRMAELLQDRTSLPVSQVTETTTVEADHVYVMSPGQDLVMHEDSVMLRERGERSLHAPIDLFLRTLAEAQGANAVGIIMSGTGSDGSVGVRYVREAGGVTVAQSPDEAEYDAMPTSAIATGLVDLVLPAGQMPAELKRVAQLPNVPVEDDADAPEEPEGALAGIMAALHRRTGHDFSLYKRSTLMRRLQRRVLFNGVAGLEEYLPLLEGSSAEGHALLRDLLISVSSFFRDPAAFEALAALVPAMFAGKGPDDPVRVWVVGCATGEEVYSLAMVLLEHASTLPDPPRIQLFATDIDERGYGRGRDGLYPTAAMVNVSPERQERFFTREPSGFRIAKAVRELVLFAGHNVLYDPPFARMDLISCRNVFIYLGAEGQQRVLETFHFALKPEGVLLLGASESVGDGGMFTSVGNAEHRLFRRNSNGRRVAARVSSADPSAAIRLPATRLTTSVASPAKFSYGAAHLQLLEQYAPPSVVVDERLNVVHLSGGAGRYLHMGAGDPTHNLLALAQDDLGRVLRTALHHAFQRGLPTARHVTVAAANGPVELVVRVRPSAQPGQRFALVIFDDTPPVSSGAPRRDNGDEPSLPQVELLEEELRRTREVLHSTSAAHDRTVAELQTVNEELLSINEEQKAATEELETGREEIQSINEELITINQEHQSTIEELQRTNGDLQNLIESTEIGTIFLDRGMRIRRFTPAVAALFHFVSADEGRPLSDITHQLDYPALTADVERVLATLARVECEVGSTGGRSFIVRINPYRSMDGNNDGAVLTFYDNTAQHRVGEELREAKAAAEAADLAKSTFLATLSHEFRTPLNGIIGYSDLMPISGPLNEAQLSHVARIKAGSWHLVSLIDDILRFSAIDGGHEQVVHEPVDARVVAAEAKVLMEPAAAAKSLAFELERPEEPVLFMSDDAKVRQVLINLCGNAIKYTDAGVISLVVKQTAERVIFEVRDTGRGIAPEHHEHIFERFWQVDGGSTRQVGGLGIGLAAAREYARLLRGDVEVQSRLGGGSTFRLWLPRTPQGDESAAV